MKNLKRVLTLTLALMLTLALLIPCACAEEESKWWELDRDNPQFHYNVESDTFEQLKLENTVISLRYLDCNWSYDGPDTFTVNPEVSEFDIGEGYEFPLGMEISAPSGLFSHIGAYSDPDGDGVYDQRLGYCAWGESGLTMKPVPTTDFKSGFLEGNEKYSYSTGFEISGGVNSLIYELGEGCAKITSEFLTEQFGPNTYVCLNVNSDIMEDAGLWLKLTGERMDPALIVEDAVAVTDRGCIVDRWALEPVNRASDSELIPYRLEDGGYDFTRNITRSEFADMTVSLYEAMSGEELPYPSGEYPFTDLTSDRGELGYIYNIYKAYNLGIVKGSNAEGTLFSPYDLVTREQAAVMLARVYEKLGGTIPATSATSFADDSEVSGYAKSAVAFMADKGILGGVGDNRFNPRGSCKCEEALVIALRMLETLK